MYIIIFFILLIFTFVEVIRKEVNHYYFKAVFLTMTFMLIFRYGQGPDYLVYEYEYTKILLHEDLLNFIATKGDYLFWIAFAGFRYLNVPFEVLIGVSGLFSMWCLYRFINKHSKYKFISIFVFYSLYYVYFDSILRQAIALSIFMLFILDYIIKERYYKAILITILASLFHQSAIIILVGILLIKNNNIKYKYILYLSAFVFLVNLTGIGNQLVNILPSFLKSRMMFYVNSRGSMLSFFNRIFMYVVVIILYVVNIRLQSLSQNDKVLVRLYSLSLLIYCMFFNLSLVASRLDVYFRILEIVIIPNLVWGLKKTNKYNVMTVLLSIFIIISFYSTINYYKNIQMFLYHGSYYDMNVVSYPYISIFNKDKVHEKSNYSIEATIDRGNN